MKTRTILAGISLLFLFTACSKSPKLKIDGNISNAEGKMLYFEQSGINKTEILDSVKLTKDGDFRFKTNLPGAPEFFRLRIEGQLIHLGADSAAKVEIQADGKNLGNSYTVEGSRSCQLIRELSLSQTKTQKSFDSLSSLYTTKQIADTTFRKKAEICLNLHRELAKRIIFEKPGSPASYFALFQNIHEYPILDPYNKSDNRLFSAVATSWQSFYPKSDRGKNLVTLTLQGIKLLRQNKAQKDMVVQELDKRTYFEIKLPNVYDKETALSSLKGKVVLVDFTAYQTKFSPSRNLKFRDVYSKYAAQGFEIYQVSLDSDENLWKTGAANLPWICVHDKSSINSKYLSIYNIQELPTYFLLDRNGNLVVRDNMVKDLNEEILKLL